MDKILIHEESDLIQNEIKKYDDFFNKVGELSTFLDEELALKLNQQLFLAFMNKGAPIIVEALAQEAEDDLKKAGISNQLLLKSARRQAFQSVERLTRELEEMRRQFEKTIMNLEIPVGQIEFKDNKPYLSEEQRSQIAEKFRYYLESKNDKELHDKIQEFCESFNSLSEWIAKNKLPSLAENVICGLTQDDQQFLGSGFGTTFRSDTFLLGAKDESGKQTRLIMNHRFFKHLK